MALSPQAIRQYAPDGYVSPIGVQAPARAQRNRQRLEAIEAFPRPPAGGLRCNGNLLLTWWNAIVRHPKVLDAVASLIGSDILVRGTSFFISMAKVDSEEPADRLRACRGLDPLAPRPVDRRS